MYIHLVNVYFFILKMTISYTVHIVDTCTLEDTKKKMIIYNNIIMTYFTDSFKTL